MNKLNDIINAFIKKQCFNTSLLGFFINSNFYSKNYLKHFIKKYAKKINPTKILDIGCGSKPYKNYFNFKEYIGIDIENPSHDHKYEDIDYYYDGKNIPFDNNIFDCILLFDVIEHVYDIDKLFNEIIRVTKPEAYLLITTPFIYPEHEIPFDFFRYTSFSLNIFLEKYGFEIISNEKYQNNLSILSVLFNEAILTNIKKYIKMKIIYYLLSIIIITISNLIGLILLFIKSDVLYFGNIILARKKNDIQKI